MCHVGSRSLTCVADWVAGDLADLRSEGRRRPSIAGGTQDVEPEVLYICWQVAGRQSSRRERAQADIPLKRARADFVIDNGGLPEQTYAQVKSFWNSLSHKSGVEFNGT